MINTVTITGADNSIDPARLIDLSLEFPFVEWGILLSRKSAGKPRFPSGGWLADLESCTQMYPFLKLSCHLCGGYVREFMKGELAFVEREIGLECWSMFQRVQINTHGEPHEWKSDPVAQFIHRHPNKTFIFQYDNINTDLLEVLARRGDIANVSALYDLSHGAGILPEEWPKPLAYCPVGYAGGLGPDNLESQIMLIETIARDTPIWIDMETKVRSNMDQEFDLDKVRKCLEIAKPFVRQL